VFKNGAAYEKLMGLGLLEERDGDLEAFF